MWRPDLLKLLDRDLSELRRYWDIESDSSLASARDIVAARMRELISGLTFRSSDDQLPPATEEARYRYCVALSFNLLESPDLRTMGLNQRRAWLAQAQRGELRTESSEARRDLADAIDQLAETMIAAREGSSTAVQLSSDIWLTAEREGEWSQTSDSEPPAKKRRRWPVVVIGVVLAMLGTVLVAAQQGLPPFDVDQQGEAAGVQPENHSLGITNYGFGSVNGGLALVYPANQVGRMKESAARLTQAKLLEFEDVDTFAQQEVEAGAYVLNGMMLEMGLEGLDEREVTVYDIRTVLTHQAVPLDAAFVLRQVGGGETPTIVNFNMDDLAPAPRERNSAGEPGEPFFSVQRLSLPKGGKETLSLWFAAKSHASEFYVDISYEVAGTKYKKRLDLNGKPFRIAPLACAMGATDPELADAYDPVLATKRYKSVLRLNNDGRTKPSLETKDPDAFAKEGCHLWQ